MTQFQFPFGRRNTPEPKNDDQLSFADYWELQRRPQPVRGKSTNLFGEKTEKPAVSAFDFRVKKRRPLWKDLAVFAMTTIGVWSVTQVGMNFSAYSQIADFKISELKTSVFEKESSELAVVPQIQKIEKVKTPFRDSKIKPKNSAKNVFSDIRVHPSDNRVVLPRIGKNVPLVMVPSHKNWKKLEATIQSGLQDGVVVHPVSHAPGNFGNFFLTGHSSYYVWDNGRYKDVFALLHELEVGDEVEVYWEGKKYLYQLDQSFVIPPTQTSVLNQPTDEKMITLMTCTPVGTNKNRLIWTGDLIAVE
ncbi:sortase [bacterium]|jgi:LPXTG-site transpeptidase (sortase) family protein|nr:sortase [bacterium]MBT6996071.1 sortase [bacterium]MBT7772520.1 sortase [bacterium]